MDVQTPYYKMYLREELARRCQNNDNYSMRSFAKALNVDPAVLSRTLADKRALSLKVAERVAQSLNLSDEELEIFLESVAEDQKQRGLRKNSRRLNGASAVADDENRGEIDAEIFRVIGDWYHYAIQQLTLIDGFRSEPKWIANKLGISILDTKLAIQRLIAVGLLERVNGTLRPIHAVLDTKDKSVSSPALRRHQKQMLQKAIYSLENHPLPIRSMSSLTLPIAADKVPIAKQMIQEFTENLRKVLTSGNKDSLYQLTVSFFPLENLDI